MAEMEQEFEKIRARFQDLGKRVPELISETDTLQDLAASASSEVAPAKPRDDDTHYFDSYSYNGTIFPTAVRYYIHLTMITEIHAVMIQDSVRTSSYATFILSNPQIFRDAVVMDVGCGRPTYSDIRWQF